MLKNALRAALGALLDIESFHLSIKAEAARELLRISRDASKRGIGFRASTFSTKGIKSVSLIGNTGLLTAKDFSPGCSRDSRALERSRGDFT